MNVLCKIIVYTTMSLLILLNKRDDDASTKITRSQNLQIKKRNINRYILEDYMHLDWCSLEKYTEV